MSMKQGELPRDDKGDFDPLKADFPVEFGLSTPIEDGGRNLEYPSVRESTVGDLEIADREKTRPGRKLLMLSLVADTAPEDLRKIGSRDYILLQELLEVLL